MKFSISLQLLPVRQLCCWKFPLSMSHCPVSICSYFSETKNGLRIHVSSSCSSPRAPENPVFHANSLPKLFLPTSLLGAGKRLKLDRATGKNHNKYNHFSNKTNSTLNGDEMNKKSFAGSDESESYDGADHSDKNAFAIPGTPALSGDMYDNLWSIFITLANNSSKNHCDDLLHVLKKNCDVITKFTKRFQLIDAILEETTKTESKFHADLGFIAESVTFKSGFTYNVFLRDARLVLQSQVAAAHSKDIYLASKINSVYIVPLNAENRQRAVLAARIR